MRDYVSKNENVVLSTNGAFRWFLKIYRLEITWYHLG